ncbi:MAG: 3'-5' exonuclease, partial [Acidimicrobiia bacterium]
ATRAVRDLLMVLRAADDPTDQLRVVAALRTPLLACGDDDLVRYRVGHGGSWDPLAHPPASLPADDPVVAGLAYLRAVHERRNWVDPSVLVEQVARERRAFELAFVEGRPRDVWRRLRFVLDQARAWCDAVGGSLRAYLTWVGQQTAEGARVAETVLPETDDDAVRIMTIHAAKGLEFPITIVSGTSTVPQVRRSKAEVAFLPTGGVGYRFGSAVTTPEFAAWAPIDEQMAFDERVRLLYVACTRARDHLVVSLHRQARAVAPARPSRRTNAELLVDGMGDLLVEVPDADGDLDGDVVPARAPAPAHPEPFAEWSADRDRALAEAARPEVVSATGLLLDPPDPAVGPPAGPEPGPVDALADPGLDKGPRGQHDDDLVGRGRYGTAVGRAVHGVLQLVDLASGQGLDGAVTVQCRAEGVADEEVVRELALAALASPTVRQAGRSRHWREVLVATPLADGRLLEGYVDLLWRRDDGLVVVDYKTADTTDPAELSRRVARYRAQGAAYAYALEATTGERVAEVTFVFLTPTGPIELPLPDLAAAVAAVQAQAVGGAPVTAG